jgi:hypothetical protein
MYLGMLLRIIADYPWHVLDGLYSPSAKQAVRLRPTDTPRTHFLL